MQEVESARALLQKQKFGSLGTLRAGRPYVSLVGYAPSEDGNSLAFLLSSLALHTQHILQDPRVSLLVTEESQTPLAAGRVSISGVVQRCDKDAALYHQFAAKYESLHSAASLFAMRDFALYVLAIEEVFYIGGFGKIHHFSRAVWQQYDTTSMGH